MYIDERKVERIKMAAREKGLRLGSTNGCFDLLHPGHVHFLQECKRSLGRRGLLVVLVNDDDYCRRTKGEDRPIIHQLYRVEMVQAIKGVGVSMLFKEEEPSKWLELLKPEVHFKGSDWEKCDYVIPESRVVKVDFIDTIGSFSTTALIDGIKRGKKNVETVFIS